MKARILLVLLLFLSACSQPEAGDSPRALLKPRDKAKLFVIHIHGDWCKTCSKIDDVIHETADYWSQRKNVEYLVFDETSAEKLKSSSRLAVEHGLEDLFEYERHTGEVLFVDQASKSILAKFYGVDTKEEYIDATEALLRGKEVESVLAEGRRYWLSKPDIEVIRKAQLLVIDVHHDLCGGCAVTAPIFEKVAKDYVRNKKICFMTFDLTTKETTDQAKKIAEELNIERIFNENKHTGEVLFVDLKDRKVLSTLVLERDQQVYHKLIRKLKRKL
ncbi:MAG: thioredoxin family protein [Candidatus Melainabacteria bacterium]|nr:thioredoxin family protein [Candidatus Melainabacteria bacterium]